MALTGLHPNRSPRADLLDYAGRLTGELIVASPNQSTVPSVKTRLTVVGHVDTQALITRQPYRANSNPTISPRSYE